MDTHVKVVAWINIILGGLGVLAGLAFLMFFGGIAAVVGGHAPQDDAAVAVPILGLLGGFLFLLFLVICIPAVIAGWGLLQYREWARILAIILSVLHLLNIPIGTAIGVYSLWVLFNGETQRLFTASQAHGARA
jgi:hypothetical protein